jgi:hypothetical protein
MALYNNGATLNDQELGVARGYIKTAKIEDVASKAAELGLNAAQLAQIYQGSEANVNAAVAANGATTGTGYKWGADGGLMSSAPVAAANETTAKATADADYNRRSGNGKWSGEQMVAFRDGKWDGQDGTWGDHHPNDIRR